MGDYVRKSKPRTEKMLLKAARTKGGATRIKRACRAVKKLGGEM